MREPMYKIRISNGTSAFYLNGGKLYYHSVAIAARKQWAANYPFKRGYTLSFHLVGESRLSPIDSLP
jgi:hypothetical protein